MIENSDYKILKVVHNNDGALVFEVEGRKIDIEIEKNFNLGDTVIFSAEENEVKAYYNAEMETWSIDAEKMFEKSMELLLILGEDD